MSCDSSMELVVFDLDGVLLDFCEIHYQTLNSAICDVAGPTFEISRKEHNTIYNGRNTRSKLKLLCERTGLPADLEEPIFQRKQALTLAALSRVDPSPTLIEFFTVLKASGVKIACASNSVRATVDTALRALGIDKYFDFTLSNEDVVNPKPDPEIYRRCHLLAGVRPDQTLIYEDSPIGLEAATASGSWVRIVETPQVLY